MSSHKIPKKTRKSIWEKVGMNGISWDFMRTHGILWYFFLIPGSLDIAEWIFLISGGNFGKFPQIYSKI